LAEVSRSLLERPGETHTLFDDPTSSIDLFSPHLLHSQRHGIAIDLLLRLDEPARISCQTMAPTNGAEKARKPAANRQGPRPVVPALPLPYVTRKAAGSGPAAASTSAPKDEVKELNSASTKAVKNSKPSLSAPNGLAGPTTATGEAKAEPCLGNGHHSTGN
jgi:hypothetical protein